MKILNTILSLIYIILLCFAIKIIIREYSDGKLLLIIISSTIYIFHLFAWLFPKMFFNICWKICNSINDGFDYETNFSKLKKIDLGMIIFSGILVSFCLII